MAQKSPTMMQKFFSSFLGNAQEATSTEIILDAEDTMAATTNLFKLIELAIEDNKFLKTEGVLRLSPNEVKKNKAINDIDSFFTDYKKEADYALLGMLLKKHLKASVTNEQKKQILIDIGLNSNDIDIGFLTKRKLEELSAKLKQTPPNFSIEVPQLSHFIFLCQKIAEDDEVNKMTPNNIAVCIAPSLLPKFGKMATRAFEKNICQLLQIVLESWIKTADTGVQNSYVTKKMDDSQDED